MHIFFPVKFKSAADNDNDLAARTIPANNFFVHQIREIHIVRYGDDQPVLPLINNLDIYRYSDEILKHMPEKALKTFQNQLLYSKKEKVLNNANRDRRLNNTLAANAADRTDANLSNRIPKFQDQIKNNFAYRIPLKFLCYIAKVNQCIKIKFDTKFMLMLKTEMKKLFETNANNVANLGAEIIFTDVLFIQ